MANDTRVRGNYVFGTLSAGITNTATSISSAGLANLPAIGSTQHAAITISDGANFEIVHVTAHTAGATTATVVRGQEGSTAQAWSSDAAWAHTATTADVPTLGVRSHNNGTTQSIPSATWTTLTAWTDFENAGSAWASGLWTVPTNYGGLWVVTCRVAWAANTTGTRWAKLVINGTDFSASNGPPMTGGNLTVVGYAWQVRLHDADTIAISVFQDSGGSLATSATSPYECMVEAIRLSA